MKQIIDPWLGVGGPVRERIRRMGLAARLFFILTFNFRPFLTLPMTGPWLAVKYYSSILQAIDFIFQITSGQRKQ